MGGTIFCQQSHALFWYTRYMYVIVDSSKIYFLQIFKIFLNIRIFDYIGDIIKLVSFAFFCMQGKLYTEWSSTFYELHVGP